MDSRDVFNLLKVKKMGNKPVLWDDKVTYEKKHSPEGGAISVFEDKKIIPEGGFRPNNGQKLSLKQRERLSRTHWPMEGREHSASILPESRIWGNSIWRRYDNGELDIRTAFQMAVEAIRKYNDGFVINEHDALILSSIFSQFNVDGLPKSIVDIKAFLTKDEVRVLLEMLKRNGSDIIIRDIVDYGGA